MSTTNGVAPNFAGRKASVSFLTGTRFRQDKKVCLRRRHKMGNRAIITTEQRDLGLYLHWNGGRDSVEPFLKYCDLKGYRTPDSDSYGWARLCQVIGNFFGGCHSVGIAPYPGDKYADPGDNGIYIIRGWEIVQHLRWDFDEGKLVEFPKEWEQRDYPFWDMLDAIDEAQPEKEQIGEVLRAEYVLVGEIEEGDIVYVPNNNGQFIPADVVGFGDGSIVNGIHTKDVPYVNQYHGGKENCNNYLRRKGYFRKRAKNDDIV